MSNPIRDEISYAILKIRSRISFHSVVIRCNVAKKEVERKKLDKTTLHLSKYIFIKHENA